MRKNSKLGRRLVSSLLVLCMMVSGIGPIGGAAYAEDSSSTSASSASAMSVDSGEAVQSSSASSTSSSENDDSLSPDDESLDNSAPVSSSAAESNNSSDSNADSSDGQDDSSASSVGGQDASSVPESSSASTSASSDSSTATDSSSSESVSDDSSDSSSASSSSNADSSSSTSSDSDEDSENLDSSENATSEEEEKESDFVSLVVNDPEYGDTVEAEVGDTVTFTATLNRDDVAVTYQWQKLFTGQRGEDYSGRVIHNYAEGEPTWYVFPFDDIAEAALLQENPEATWSGAEMYYAIVDVLDSIGADSSNVSIAWRTPNYALDGYVISAVTAADGVVEIHAEKDGELHIGRVNAEGKWEFADAVAQTSAEESWVNIEGATSPEYTFTVSEEDYETTYRCQVEVVDESYKAKAIELLAEQGVELTDEQKAQPQYLYSIAMHVYSETWEAQQQESMVLFEAGTLTMSSMVSMLANAANTPRLSSDAQWIEGLNSNYEYISKDTYDRVQQWLKEGKITQTQADRYWTKLTSGGFYSNQIANVLDENGMPTGETRYYRGFTLTNGNMLEVNSEWYGKTVYFRPRGSQGTGTAIKIPAYTDLTVDADGNYVESSAGSKYKTAITVLNAFVKDTGSMYSSFISTVTENGWLLDSNDDSIHIQLYAVDCETFNADPERFLVDAEGNYRMDSFAWGVCTSEEPDLSGKAYWVLKDYIANGYGMLAGHDTMYAYAGAYYDSFGTDLDESTIDPNDGTTWYYDLNSWLPTAHDPNGNLSTTRGGHFYMNQLMGSNAGSVYSGTTAPADAPSKILSTGGSNGLYSKAAQFGTSTLKILMNGYSLQQAIENPKYRTPTNYPYFYPEGINIQASETHTNQQAAFANIWVNYYGTNVYAALYGYEENPRVWYVDGKSGTNNFYLAGDGNFLMNQIGHLPQNSATRDEARIFANSIMYVSQRKQCEICAANQDGQQTAHFVRRVNSANAEDILTALQNGGNYWYPLDGCYMLTEDITLPEDWTPIEHFNGHWNSDVYTVTLNSEGTPLLANDSADGASGWNLGTDQFKGTENVFDGDMNRVTGVARVVGDLNDLFGTDMNYAGYTVKILGSDNPSYMKASEVYSCTVNSDSKYVISNLPCVYDNVTKSGVLNVRVYTPSGQEVTNYGIIRVNVQKEFWDNDMTTPLYLGNFTVEPVANEETYESAQAIFYASSSATEPVSLVGWQYRENDTAEWKYVPTDWDTTETHETSTTADGGHIITSKFVLNNTDPAWAGYEFRAVFTSEHYGQWSTYDYYLNGIVASLDGGTQYVDVKRTGNEGALDVLLWPAFAMQGSDKTVYAGTEATFESTGYALDDGTAITATWQYSTTIFDPYNGGYVLEWHDIEGTDEFGGTEKITTNERVEEYQVDILQSLLELNPQANADVFKENAKFHSVSTTLTVDMVDVMQSGTHFRVHYTATSSHGTKVEWYSDIADDKSHSWTTETGEFGITAVQPVPDNSNILTVKDPELEIVTTPSALSGGAANVDTMTPDEYGQMLLLPSSTASIASGTAVYEAILYYAPNEYTPNPTWQYMSYTDRTPRFWADADGNVSSLATSKGVKVTVQNTDLGIVGTGEYKGYYAIKSVMTMSNVPISMYNSETLTKYYFSCIGNMTYTTVKDTYEIQRIDKWGGLSMDYVIDIQHNGVLNYGQKNNINGMTVTDSAGIATATNGKTSSTWKYPNLSIHVPGGRHVNTAIITFDNNVAHDSRDTINYDRNALASLGITVSQASADSLVLVSTTKNTVATSTWETALRNYVSFTTYDSADFSVDKVVSNTTGGAKISWIVDEMRLAGVSVDTKTGHAYKVVNAGRIISWDEAYSAARAYNSDLGVNGYLAEITSAEENSLIYSLKGGNNGVRAWIGGHKPSSWQWATSKAGISYTPSGGIQGDGQYLAMNSNGSWSGLKPSSTSVATYTMYNIGWVPFTTGHPWVSPNGTTTGKITLTYGHKYYVLGMFGDNGDSNGGGPISFPAFGIYADCNLNGNYNGWLSGVDGVYTYYGATGEQSYSFTCNRIGTEVSGNYANIFFFNVYDLTATFGAGNEPSLSWLQQTFYGGGSMTNATYTPSKTVSYTTQVITDVRYYVVEYDIPSLAMAITNHSAEDTTYIGTNAKVTQPAEKTVTAVITGASKVYDGTQISPSNFTVFGSEGASVSLFEITYEAVEADNFADYTTRTVAGTNWQNTGAVNATRYRATVSLTDEAVAAGWELSDTSVLQCDLVITQRPVNVYSYHNDKTYDRSYAGMIQNIQMETRNGNTGVIPGDTVSLNVTSVFGYYVDSDGKVTTHNSTTNNGGNEYTMYRNSNLSSLYIVHNESSDPHHNYVLGTETYTGDILQRGLYVHSLYLEDPDYPRNVKSYDGTTSATISDIIIDGVLDGDSIGLESETLKGYYESANAGETLNSDGTAQSDRLKKLQEYEILLGAEGGAKLSGNEFGDYFIEREEYSGAISRATLMGQVMSDRVMYGVGLDETPWHDTVAYEANKPATSGCWLSLVGLKGNDTLLLDYAKSDFEYTGVTDPEMEVTKETPVGKYGLTYTGLTEENYPVLSNYIVAVMDGMVEVYPREIRITVEDSNRYVNDETLPSTHSTFELINEDEETYTLIGSDSNMTYEEMALLNGDTVQSTVLVKEQGLNRTSPLVTENANSTIGYNDDGIRSTIYQHGTSIPYSTDWFVGAPAKYLDLENDYELHDCAWCEEYHGFKTGTDHWTLDSYEVRVNQDNSRGRTLDIAYVYNAKGERVQNYTLGYVSGKLYVHPELRFQLNATVPMYVCMYGYNGDGEVVEPTEYGITNYSNGPIKITDIEVAQNGWNITDKAPLELQRGELSMKMKDTQLVTGHNTPFNQEQWVVEGGEEENGVKFDIPLTCYIAGGNVNDAEESYVTKVTYTVAEYGITVPEVEGVELPSIIGGEPVTVIPAE